MIKKILIQGANFVYAFFKLLPTKKKVTMLSRQSNSMTLDFELLKKEFNEKNPEIQISILCRRLEGGAKASLLTKIKYMFHCLRQMYHIATSKVVILDSYCILISTLKHKKTLKVIQMWHSIGTMKKFGYQILGLEEGRNKKLADEMKMHRNYDYIFASSKEYAHYLAEGFGYGIDKVKVYSLPRVDLLNSQEYKKEITEKIYKEYPKIQQKKNIVYCPTYRKSENKMAEEIKKLIKKVDYEKYNLIIKLHPLSKIEIKDNRVINDKNISGFDMLFVADYIISDYSCIVYEAAILNKPLYFWAFDFKKYRRTRGITFDYKKEVPGIVSEKVEDILKEIDEYEYDYNRLCNFREKYVTNIEDCTEKIAKFIEKIMCI